MDIILTLRKLRRFFKSEADWNSKYLSFKRQFNDFKSRSAENIKFVEYPCLEDNTAITPIEPHYTYHPAWAARVLAQINPSKHIDISSTTNFSTIASAFVPFEFFDYRPANIHLSNFKSERADLTNLHFDSNSIESLSCMHTVEHIGLGRYGDPIDFNGDLKAIKELERVVKPGGNLLFVVPVGIPKIAFNAHRIYSYDSIIKAFSGLMLKEFCLVPDDFEQTGYIKNPPIEFVNKQTWGCGCFWFIKPA